MTAVILSVLALVLSVTSLVWQAWSWSRSGPVLKAFTARPGSSHYVSIRVVNSGRAAATVERFGYQLPDKTDLTPNPMTFDGTLPGRIDPHASRDFVVVLGSLIEQIREHGAAPEKVRPWVENAAGKRVYAKKGVPLT